jgi:tetratricopeptide (TPR) repeat protein
MAKKIVPKKPVPVAGGRTAAFVLPELHGNGWLFLKNFWFQAIAITLVGFVFYFSTRTNNYALDDDIIMKQNMYVQKGFSGIPEILGNDAYKSYYESMGVEQQLEGGRYRPLSVVTFAMEQQIFGECYGERYTEVRDSLFDMQKKGINDANTGRLINEKNDLDKKIKATNDDIAGLRHIFQVCWFVISLLVLLWFLREHIFRTNTDIAFLAVLLFAIHPIHTEVVANVKSRDEIFSLLFIGLTFIFFFRYDLKRKTKDLVWGLVSLFLALLSKEYAALMVILIPAGLMIFHKRKLRDLTYLVAPLGVMMFLYIVIHFAAVGGKGPAGKPDPFNDPYLYATPQQTFLSKINRLDDYIWLLFYPWPLSSEYYYPHFPYSDVTDIFVWISFFVHIGLVILLVKLWQKRHPLAFALLIYFVFFGLVSNILFDTGATIAERLIYHSSLGFCMIIAWLMVKGVEKLKTTQPYILTGVLILLSIPAFNVTQKRNADWNSDYTLFTEDVKTHPNSGLANGNAGARYMDSALYYLGRDTTIGLEKVKLGRDTVKVYYYANIAEKYLAKAVKLHKDYAVGYLNLGLCYYYTNRYEEAAKAWGQTYRIFPSHPILRTYEQMLLGQAQNRAAVQDYAGAAKFYGYAVTALPSDVQAWADYGGASFMARDFATAKIAFNTAMQKDKKMEAQLKNGYLAADHNEAVLNQWKQDSTNVQANLNLAVSYMGTQQFQPSSRRLLNKVLVLEPGNPRAVKLLDSLGGLEQQQELKAKGLIK